MSLLMGVKEGGGPAEIPLTADGTAVKTSGTGGTLPTGAATAANQTSGGQKTQVVDASGNVAPAGDTATRPLFVELSDGAAAVGTSGNPVRVNPTAVVVSASADAGQNLAATGTSAAFSSAVATVGVLVKALPANTDIVYVALTTATTAASFPLSPGESQFFPGVLNASSIRAIAASGTQNVRALAI